MAQDYDTTPDELTYKLSFVSGGAVVYKDEYHKTLKNFTQTDINQERVVFMHDGNNLNGQIHFVLTDGEHTTTEQVLNIITNPVTLELVKNENLHVFPLTKKQIMPEQLHFKCSDLERDVKFVVTIAPQTGRILYENPDDGTTSEVSEFTQQDIRSGRVIYEHTHTMIELKSNDSFYFDVTAKLANSLMDQVFNIDISVSSGGLLRFLPVPKLHLDEGESAPIKLDLSKVLEYLEIRAGIQEPELYIDSYPPNHGAIEVVDSTKNTTKFMLNDFTAGKVFYRHDHSDTVEDKILMAVYLVQGQIFLCNLTIPVVINPVNDHPFYLVTQSPQMSIVEGENGTITKIELFTDDLDTDPSNIIYDIISGPTLGGLVKISEEGVAQDIITYGNQFTQQDVNENRIQYVHFGLPQSTTFYFKVSDGKFKPAYEIFNLRVLPVTIAPGLESEVVSVPQGLTMAFIESKHVPIETNAHKSRLVYNITENPSNGYVLVNNKASLRFSQAQLDAQQITYMQRDMNKSSDSFKVTVYIPDTSLAGSVGFNVKIIVEPIIKINGISITSADKIRLASTIATDNPTQMKLNRYNPKITIIRKPDHGVIRKIIRTSGDTEHLNDKDVTSFTYKELKSGIVYFVARKLPEEVTSINDYFEYVLHIKTVQPAQGFVPIEIHKITAYSPNDRSNNDVDVVTYEAFSFNYVIIVSMVAIMIVLATIMIILIKCRSRETIKSDPDKDYPPPLPRPPDFMPMNNNRIYSSSDGGDSIPVTASSTPLPVLSSIPHCKVIPIELDDSGSDDLGDMNIDGQQMPRYPYGDENDEWSSSCDIGNEVNYSSIAQPQQHEQRLNNPLLRRNQYWV